ncbi:MAG: GGDEF domain-containing protein [Clostridiales bacterium]|jgi:diguanylate cyclase (GGDEF)-like protein|nr:GGDEF domain-containing protein [Clostridiales bacterium]
MLGSLSFKCVCVALLIVQQVIIARLRRLVTHDKLTGVYNRYYFEKCLKRLNGRRYSPLTLIFADMDKLKEVNDAYGHAQGDEVLIAIAKLLKERAPRRAIVSRIGGDEFVVVVPRYDELKTMNYVREVKSDILLKQKDFNDMLSASIGFAIHKYKDETVEGALKRADLAMYAEKELARDKSRPYHQMN